MQYNEDEKECVRIIAKWFRENKRTVNRSEAMKEFGVDDDRYDVLIKLMEHNGVVERVESVMGKGGYAIAFWPSAYAEELAREFDTEDKSSNENRAYGGNKENETNQKNKYLEDHAALQNDFIKFLKGKKGYRNSTMIMQERDVGIDDRGVVKGIRQYLAIFEHEKQKLLAIVEFGLNEDNITIQMGWQQFMYVNRNVASSDIEGYVVFPDDAGLGEEFSIIKLDKDVKGYESLLCEDFPTYEDLRRKRENETEASGGEDGVKNDVQSIIKDALEAFKNNKYSEAIELCDKALSINPNHIKAMNIRGTIYSRSGKYDKAITQFDVILQKEPSNVIALEGKGLALLNKKDYVATYDTFQLLAKLDPDNIAAWHSMGEALFNRESFDEAIVCLDKAIKINPHSDRSWVFKAKALLKKGKYEDAISCFDEALKNAADKTYALVEKGIAYREVGKKSEEFNCYNLSIENNPKYIEAYVQKAHSLSQGEDYDGAIECLKKGIDNDLEPQQESILWHNLAVTYQRMNNYEEAYRSINRSLELYDNEHTRMVRDAIEGDMSSKGAGSDDEKVADFKSELTDIGKELLDRLVELIRSDPAFVIKPATSNYINIRIKKPRRAALQIHKVADEPSQLGLAIAGWDADDPEIRNKYAIVRRDIKRLSGLHDTTQENFWLRGKIQSQAKRNFPPYEAKVYIIDPGILDDEEVWEELKELLQYAKEVTGKGKTEGIVSKILKVFGRIAILRSDEVSDVDDLGRETLIDAFADTIIHTDFNNGFTLALMGNWGEGKSSVMEILKKKLKERQKGKFDFALFNAWEYEQTGKTAAGLAQEVVKGLREKNIFMRQFQRVAFAYKENKLSLLILVGFIISPVLLYLLRQYYDPTLLADYLEKKPNLKEFLDGLIKVAYVILPLFGIGLFKKNTEHPLDIKLQTYFKLPDYGEHLGLIPVLKRHITTLCKLKLKRSIKIPFTDRQIGKDRKLLVFVDDLDRCKSVYIAETLDAIRLVMTIPNVIVMICIDHRIAFKAIERHYRTLAEVEEEDGNRRSSAEVARDYLGKIIQLPVRLEPVKHGILKNYVYEKLFLFEKAEWEHFEERPESPIVTQPIETSGMAINKVPEIDTLEEVKGKPVVTGGKGQGLDVNTQNDANALKPEQNKRKKGRKSDDKKSDDIEIKDRPEEGREFYRLAGLFEFNNPRQLLRLHNSFRFLKALGRGKEYDTLDMLRMLFWQEFLHNWPIVIRDACMAVLIDEVHAEKVKPIARRVLYNVREDIIKLFNEPENYAELAEFVRIVVLPHNEEGIIDNKEEINEWLKKQAELAKKAQGSQGN